MSFFAPIDRDAVPPVEAGDMVVQQCAPGLPFVRLLHLDRPVTTLSADEADELAAAFTAHAAELRRRIAYSEARAEVVS